MTEEKIRKALTDQASVANSPFLPDQKAFCPIDDTCPEPSRVLTIVEDEYLPRREQVAKTKLFAFSALAIGSCMVGDQSSNPPPKHSGLQGFPSDLFPRDKKKDKNKEVTGYNRLVKYATTLLTQIRSDLFLALAMNMAESKHKGGVLLRLRPLTPNDHVTLGRWLESGDLDVAVGLDTSQPDVGEQDIFMRISHLPELEQQSDYGFRCMSDQQITALLREKERTGLFWRYGGRAPSADSAYSVGSCYARLGNEREFAPVRFDVVARTEELQKRTSEIISYLAKPPLITPGSDLLKNLSDVLGSDNVAVPQFAQHLLEELGQRRQSQDSEFHKFYKDREARLL